MHYIKNSPELGRRFLHKANSPLFQNTQQTLEYTRHSKCSCKPRQLENSVTAKKPAYDNFSKLFQKIVRTCTWTLRWYLLLRSTSTKIRLAMRVTKAKMAKTLDCRTFCQAKTRVSQTSSLWQETLAMGTGLIWISLILDVSRGRSSVQNIRTAAN